MDIDPESLLNLPDDEIEDALANYQAARHGLLVRRDFGAFCRAVLAETGMQPAAHHRLIIAELQRAAETPGARLMLFLPPGSAKSTYASVLFPAWYLAQGDGLRVIGASYGASLAETFSGRVQRVIRDHAGALGYELEREAVDRWTTSRGGEYLASGVGGPIAGFRADLAIIDDPVKSQEEADSERYRDRTWEWYLSDLRPRLRPGGRIVLITTRWHEDDLAGRILLHSPGDWRVLKLPAIAEDDDPLGRAPGEPLWGDDPNYRYDAAILEARENYEKTGNLRAWYALYQQSPRALEGSVFRVDRLVVVDDPPPPEVIQPPVVPGGHLFGPLLKQSHPRTRFRSRVRAWDLAATAPGGSGDPDWTVGVLLSELEDGRWLVEDVRRERGGPEMVERLIRETAAMDGRDVTVRLPIDGPAGKMQVSYLTRRLAGLSVVSDRETKSKATRAMPVAAQVNAGNVMVLRRQWTRAFIEELRSFPAGVHDDQVDALAAAFNVLSGEVEAPRPRIIHPPVAIFQR